LGERGCLENVVRKRNIKFKELKRVIEKFLKRRKKKEVKKKKTKY
jgi:hypothetical protein